MNDLKFESYTLLPGRRELRRSEEVIPLNRKAFDLLQFFAENAGRPLAKAEILEAVWPGTFVEESNLNQNVFVLRRALGPDGDRLIVTLPRLGYQFTAPVTRLDKALAIAEPTLTPISSQTTQISYEEEIEERFVLHRSPVAWAIAAAGLLLLASVAWLAWQRWQDRVGGPPVQVVVAEPDGSTGDPVLDRTLATVFRMELAQSPFVSILSSANVKAKMVQMEHKPDDHLTPALAREVCERSASQAVVHGSMAKAGDHYILTEEATNCVDGASLGEGSREVSKPDDLPGALAKLAGKIRHDLGESRRNIARFNRPLSPVTTGSLEALKNLTEGERLVAQGHVPEGIGLLKQAVAIDPTFAGAWLDLSTFALNAHETNEGRGYLQKAYDLRQNATEPTRRLIIARFNSVVTGDLYEGLRNYESWTDEYPRQINAWSGMTVIDRDLGKTAEGLAAAQRTMALAPTYQVVFQGLADAQLRVEDFAGSRATLQTGIAKGFDGDSLRNLLFRLGYLQHDPALIAEQEAWGREHPFSPYLLGNEALFAQIQGRREDADRFYQELAEACEHLGLQELLNNIKTQSVAIDAAYGLHDRAQRTLAAVKPNPTDAVYLYALQYTGDSAKMESLLKDQLAANPHSTLWNDWDGPLLRGKMLLDQGKPREALTVLEPTRVFDQKDVDGLYLRGLAEMQLSQLPQADAEFRKIIDHPEINPTAFQRPLAQLQLARVLARENNRAAAAAAYKAFLDFWAHADPGQPLLATAKSELAALSH